MCSLFSLNHANRFYGDSTYMGASGGLASVLTFFVLNFPKETIYVYFIPVPAWAFGVFIFGYSYLNYDSRSSVSHAGHLGGILAGACYYALKRRI
jgi:membrane associated rhomboid family serine protease